MASIGLDARDTGLKKQLPTEAPRQASGRTSAKRTAAQAAEEIVAEARRIIGPRFFIGGHPLERISAEVVFAPLVGEPLAVIAPLEKRIG